MQGKDAGLALLILALLLAALWWGFGPIAGDKPLPVPAALPAAQIAPSRDEKDLSIVADQWCPVSCSPASGQEGYAIELVRGIFSAAGYRVDYRVQPWGRAVAETRKGNNDVIVGILVENAPDFVYPVERIGMNTNVLFTRANSSWQYQDLTSLASVTVGVVNEYVYGEPFDGYVRAHQHDPARIQVLFSQDPVMQGLDLVDMKRMDAYLDDRMVVRWTLAKNHSRLRLREAGEVSAIPLYVAFSPVHPEAPVLAAVFDKGLRAMRADGRLGKLLAKYSLEDWQPATAAP